MIAFNCSQCGCFFKVDDSYSGKSVRCKKCSHVTTVPAPPEKSVGFVPNVAYKSDGITPNFDELFLALAKEEREAPTLSGI